MLAPSMFRPSAKHGNGRPATKRPAWGRLGSRLAARNHDAGDVDFIHVIRANGFVVPFTVTTTGVLQVSVDLICLLCRHQIKTEDEWGWSDFTGDTASIFVLSVFWNHDDGEPMSETYDTKFVEGLHCSGDGESSTGTVVQVAPGERRSVDLYTDAAFPVHQDNSDVHHQPRPELVPEEQDVHA